jgi:uncharacterized membrane protein YebE (DUF533 family)
MGMPEQHHTFQQKVDAIVSYGGGGSLALASFLSDLATIAQQLGMIIGCAVMAFKLYRDIEKYIQEKRARKNGTGKDIPPQDKRG